MEQAEFIKRLVQLRMNKGVSARDMSLSLGQSESYISTLENGKGYPSMPVFFYICEYFGITPKECFDLETTNPQKTSRLAELSRSLNNEQLDLLIALVKEMKK